MAEERDGKIKNWKVLAFLKVILDRILEDGKSNSADFSNTIPLDDENRILEDDKDTFEAIMNMRNYLERSPLNPEETYVIPGFMLYDENGRKTTATLYIPKNEAKIMAEGLIDKADFFRDNLGIEFPAQVYQLQRRYIFSTIPGTDTPVPEPRLMSESPEEYEERLERTYNEAGMDKELIPDTNIREPYAHERVDYSESDEISNGFQSEYYSAYRRREARRNINPNSGDEQPTRDDTQTPPTNNNNNNNNNDNDNGPFVVTESEDYERTPLAQKLGAFLNITDHSIKSKSNHQKLKTLAAIAGATAGGVVILTTPAIQPLAIAAVGIGAIYAGAKAALKFSQNKIAPKVKDFLFGRRRQEEPELTQEGEQPTQQPTPGQRQTPPSGPAPAPQPRPQPRPQPAPTGDGGHQDPPAGGRPDPTTEPVDTTIIDGFVQATSEEMGFYDELENELNVIRMEIRDLEATDSRSPRLFSLRQQESALISQMKAQLMVISTYARDFIDGMNQTMEESEGRVHGHN